MITTTSLKKLSNFENHWDSFEKEFNCEVNCEKILHEENRCIKGIKNKNENNNIVIKEYSINTFINTNHSVNLKAKNKKFKAVSNMHLLELINPNNYFNIGDKYEESTKINGDNGLYTNETSIYVKEKILEVFNENGSQFKMEENKENIENGKNYTIEELCEEEIKNFSIQKLIFDKNVNGIETLLKSFTGHKNLQEKILDTVDIRGNTPLMLCVLLRSQSYAQEYLEIMSILLSNDANLKIRNGDQWRPLEVATSYEDAESVCLIYDHLLKRRNNKIKRHTEKAGMFLSLIPDFYFEMYWEVNVPVLGFLCPKDTCKIWKFDKNVKMDYSFVQFKSLSSVRRPSTFLFKDNINNNSKNIFKIDHQSKSYFNQFEELDEEEKSLIIKDIMNSHRLNGEFKLKNCIVNEAKSYWTGKPVYDTIDGIRAQKYEVNITAFVNINKKEKFEFDNLEVETYLDDKKVLRKKTTVLMDEQKLKTHFADSMKVKNDMMRNQIMNISNNKDKKLKAYVWIAEDYPIKSQDLVALFDSLSSANEYTQKIKEFLNDPEVKKIIGKNGFPIKIMIPVNFFVDVTVNFSKYK